jgi:hypothetical protein
MKKMEGMPASITFSKDSTINFWVVSSSRKDERKVVVAESAVVLLPMPMLLPIRPCRLCICSDNLDNDDDDDDDGNDNTMLLPYANDDFATAARR